MRCAISDAIAKINSSFVPINFTLITFISFDRSRMITLYQFAPAFGLRSASPFCLKLETYCRMAQIPYEVVETLDLRAAPNGKIPYIKDGDRVIGDSTFVIEYLKATYGDTVDAHLTPTDRAIALAMQRLMEENFYWVLVYSRWENPTNWPKLKQEYFASLPPILKKIVPGLALKSTRKNLFGHGMGRHTAAEVYAIGQKDLIAISDFLGDKPFLMGDQPCSVDAIGYATLVNALCEKLTSPLLDQAQQLPNLIAYCTRMQQRYYPD
jgi:glutathione S-transferase